MFMEAIIFSVLFLLLPTVLFEWLDELQHFDDEENKADR